jgi:AcrR family transcriptional regulator
VTEPTGRRERKKAQTRRSLADAALQLFLERGYDTVGVKEVADAADVSVSTLFKHFPSKEALVFDQDDDIEAALVDAVRDRPAGQSIPDALREYVLSLGGHAGKPGLDTFTDLVNSTPALSSYGHQMWVRHAAAVAAVIAAEVGAPPDDVACAALARFALEARGLVLRDPDPQAAASAIFGLLENGFAALYPNS